MKRILLPFAIVLAALAAAYLGVGLLVALALSAPDRRPAERTPADVGLGYREVDLQSTDGVPLAAWWVSPPESSSRAAVLVHGWGWDKPEPSVIASAQVYARAGYGVLLLDLRGHGGSGDARRTLGYREPRDVAGALAWLEGEGFEPGEVVLHG